MRLLDRYLLRELLIPLAYCLSGFLVFWMAFDLFARLDDFQEDRVPPEIIARHYLINVPEFLVLVVPIALLLALLFALTTHARHHELTAIRAAGISLWRLSLPYISTGFFLSIGLFALNELWVPTAVDRADQLLAPYKFANMEERAVARQQNSFFRNARGDRTWKLDAFNFQTAEIARPQVFWMKADGSRREMFAERAYFNEEEFWVFENVQVMDFPSTPGGLPYKFFTNSLAMPEFAETPEQIKSEIKVNALTNKRAAKKAQLSMGEIFNYRKLHPEIDPKKDRMLAIQLQGRLAEPWTCLVVVLIAIPFGSASGRRNAFVGVAASIFICFAYFVFLRFGLALGMGGYLPPWMAAWLPNLTGALVGLTLIWRTR